MNRGKEISLNFLNRLKTLPGPLLIIFMLLSAAISVSGYFYYQKQKKHVYREQTAQLQAIANLKANEISQWLHERLGNANQIMENRILTAELLAFINEHLAGRNQESIRIWMESLQKNYHYQNVILLNQSGESVYALNDPVIGPKELGIMEAVKQRKQAIISDLYFLTKTTSPPLLDVLVPLLSADSVSGFVILRIDPGQYLYPMIQSWPTPSPSAETLLVRREGEEIVFLNELRHRQNSAMKLRFPLKAENLPAVQAVLGRQGIFSGTDYRGIPVWSVVRPIQNSPWFIVAKIDREEIEQPIRRSIMGIFLVALSLILATTMIILFLWQRQSSRYRLKQLAADNQKQALVQHFDYLSRYANDIILLCNENGNILEANERAIITYGYGRDTLLQMNLYNLRVPEERDKLAGQMQQAEKKSGLIFETLHQRKDGSVFPVEVSARTIVSNDKKYFQNIVRDISERKQAEESLRENESFLNNIIEQSPLPMWISDSFGTLIRINLACCELLHIRKDEVIGKYNVLQDSIVEAQGLLPKVSKVFENGETVRFEIIYESAQLQNLELSQRVSLILDTTVFPIKDIHDRITHAVIQNLDITERKQAEEKVKQSATKWSTTFDAIKDAIALLAVDQTILQVNKAFAQLVDKPVAEIIGKKCYDFIHFNRQPDQNCPFAKMLQSKKRESMELSINDRMFEIIVDPIMNDAGTISGVVHIITDITERKKAEEKISTSLKEKEILLQEIHHRVKNNLQIISGLLTLQAEQAISKPLNDIFQESHDRIRSIALIHEKLIHSDNLAEIDFSQYLRNLTENLLTTYINVTGRVNLQFDTESVFLSIETAIPLGLIVNEMVTNCLKYAFSDGRQGEINIALHGVQGTGKARQATTYELTVADNGVGLPSAFKIGTQKSLGMHLISMLVKQLQAELKIGSETGTRFSIYFPLSKEIVK